MEIREAKLSDLEAIIQVDRDSYVAEFGDEMSKEEMAFQLEGRKSGYEDLGSGKDTAIVAVKDGSVIGYLQLGRIDDNSAQIKRVYVLPGFQNKGLGRDLLSRTLQKLSSYKKIYANTWKDNKRAQYLYSSLGFKPTGRRITWVNHKGEEDGYDIEMAMER